MKTKEKCVALRILVDSTTSSKLREEKILAAVVSLLLIRRVMAQAWLSAKINVALVCRLDHVRANQ